jgi:DNA polymerase
MTNQSHSLYDTESIGKWSDWQGSLAAKILIVGQDWGTFDYWVKQNGIDRENNRTNETLRQLCLILGYEIGTVTNPIRQDKLFFTNAVLCLKSGNMSSPLSAKVYSNCNLAFLQPLFLLIKPKYIISLGSKAYETIIIADGKKVSSEPKISEVCGKKPIKLQNGAFLFPVFHCGGLGLANRQIGKQFEDWKNIKEFIANNEAETIVPDRKSKKLLKITLQDLPYSKDWTQVQDFAFSLPMQELGYSREKADKLFTDIESNYWQEGLIDHMYTINDLRAALYSLFNTKRFTAQNYPSHKDILLIESIIIRLNKILYDNLWDDR